MRYCQAGLNHIWLRNDSRAQVCCSIPQQGNSYTLDKPSDFLNLIKDESFIKKYKILETAPIKKQCDICVKNEKNVGHSQRHKINDITKHGKKFFLKIDFSNKCNLKCIMCSSSRSTAWIKDEKKLNELGHDYPIDPHTSIGDQWWNDIDLSWWRNLGGVEISGGEPLYQEEALQFLDFLSTSVPQVQLRIITNATLFDDYLYKIFKRFEYINVLCSVDAWEDDVYQYSRGGVYKLDDIKNVLTKLYGNVQSMGIADTIHCVTYDQPAKGIKWLKDNGLHKVRHNSNFVYSPEWLNVHSVLPSEFFPKGKKDKKLQQYFVRWITDLDKVRGTNILDIRPEFKDWFDLTKNTEML